MTILKIFKPEDYEEANAITTLSDGEHFVGREKLSDCHDKRVSRKHALIQVRADGVTLTSVHVNPCYFKSLNANSIQLIRKDSTVTLKNGDQFALLVDMFWYKVKVITNSNTVGASTSQNGSFSTNQVKDALKRILDHSDNNDVCKRLKTCNGKEQVLPTIRTSYNNIPSVSLPNIDTSSLISNLNTIINEDYNNTTIQNRSSSEERNENVNTENSRINIELSVTTNESNDLIPVNNIQSTTPTDTISNHPTETPNDNCAVPRIETEVTNENADVTGEIPSGESVPTDIPIQTIKKEIVESDSASENVENTNIQLSPLTSISLSNSVLSAEYIKTEATHGENVNSNTSTSTEPNTGLSTENIKKEAPDKNTDGPCSSSDSNTNTRRDRCWYGQSCYRKNPIHRSNLSHPGDGDYDSDPNDDRQVCPFGPACYRVNMEHRRKFKHYGRPAPKPDKVRVQINVNSACPFCSHCSNNCRKPDYESDYDSDGGNEL